MRQQRLEHLICSKFYFQSMKGIQFLFRLIYKIMQNVNKVSRKNSFLTILICEKVHRNAHQEFSTYG